ncbi:MAG: hypothetical protein HC836_10615 [Richelia sp. RM2_1_2]|nr:hypothetical protein [Richelia sp. RM2_1_2]
MITYDWRSIESRIDRHLEENSIVTKPYTKKHTVWDDVRQQFIRAYYARSAQCYNTMFMIEAQLVAKYFPYCVTINYNLADRSSENFSDYRSKILMVYKKFTKDFIFGRETFVHGFYNALNELQYTIEYASPRIPSPLNKSDSSYKLLARLYKFYFHTETEAILFKLTHL